ncbi:MAG: hypothetical protein AB201_00060 [Parcubacteria bacterium C7867-006]|nr:MAG: hypothetical protein AB201_00060 [Parcubacteria bacterium C7867-006]
MSKKIIITISVILGLFLISLVAYYFIATTNTGDGTTKTTGFRSFFPFGGNDLPPTQTEATTTEPTPIDQNNQQNFTKKLRKISEEPVAGAGTLDSKAGTVVRYIEKATGHIYEVELFSPRQARISNTTIPVVYDAVWGNKNDSLVARYLKDDNQTVDTYSLTVKNLSTSTENTITGIAMPANIDDVSSYGSTIFFLIKSDSGSSGFTSNFDGSKKKQVWNSQIKELSSQFINSKTVALTTKPAQNIPGYLYFVDTTTGSSKRVLGDIAGLSTLLDGLGSQVVFLEQTNDAKLFLYNIKNKTKTNITPTTFPEKCVWSKKDTSVLYCAVPRDYLSGNSLISWYKGIVSHSDDIWKFDLKNNTSNIIEDLGSNAKEDIDVIKPFLSENEQYLIFMNKKDNTLWSLDLLQS